MTYNPIPTTPHYNTAPASRDARFCVSTLAESNLLRNNLAVCSSFTLHNTVITMASAICRCSPLLFQYKHKTGMTDISSKYG